MCVRERERERWCVSRQRVCMWDMYVLGSGVRRSSISSLRKTDTDKERLCEQNIDTCTETDRQSQRERGREKERERQTDRQTDRQGGGGGGGRQTDRRTDRQTDSEREREGVSDGLPTLTQHAAHVKVTA